MPDHVQVSIMIGSEVSMVTNIPSSTVKWNVPAPGVQFAVNGKKYGETAVCVHLIAVAPASHVQLVKKLH